MIRLKQILIILLTVVIFLCLPIAITEATANNQSFNRTAELISPKPSYEIYIYPQPNQDKKMVGYGFGGDKVTVINEVDRNNGGFWYLVKFSKSPYFQGWVEDNYVALQKEE